jgi:hypothetical protein
LGSEGEKMKKYLALVLGMLFVLGFAASAFAIHASIPAETTGVVAAKDIQIQLEGEIRIRGWYEDNITTSGGAKATTGRPYDGGSMSWYDQRVRLAVDTKIGDNVSGRIHLETDPENYTWGGTNTIGTAGLGGVKRGDRLSLLEAWLAYTGKGLLGVPAGIKVGHMPVVIGAGTFFDHRRYGDDAILLWIEPAKGTEINLLTAKLFEGAPITEAQVQCTNLANPPVLTWVPATTGCTAAGLAATGRTRTVTLVPGGATDNTDDLDLYSLMLTHKLDKDHTIGANLSVIKSSDVNGGAGALGALSGFYRMRTTGLNYDDAKVALWNAGLSAKGKVSGIGYKATVDFQFGKAKDITGPVTEQKFRGYGITAGVDYKVDPVTIRANFVYGSGDSNDTDNKNKAFQTFVGNVIDPNLPTVVYNWRVDTAAGSGIRGTGIANTTAYNVGLTMSPIKDLTAHLDYYLLRASKKLNPTGFGSDKKIGSEVDLKVTYRLARNLTYSINSGILFADDFYKTGTPGVTSDPKNAVVLQHQLVLSF